MKTCTGCSATKPLDEFPRHGDRPYSRCKTCHCEAQRERREKHGERIYAAQRANWKKNGHRYRPQQAQYRMFKRHGANTADEKAYYLQLVSDPCAYCDGFMGVGIDHIEPRVDGGENHWSNLTAACVTCNVKKNRNPLLYHLLTRNGL